MGQGLKPKCFQGPGRWKNNVKNITRSCLAPLGSGQSHLPVLSREPANPDANVKFPDLKNTVWPPPTRQSAAGGPPECGAAPPGRRHSGRPGTGVCKLSCRVPLPIFKTLVRSPEHHTFKTFPGFWGVQPSLGARNYVVEGQAAVAQAQGATRPLSRLCHAPGAMTRSNVAVCQ